MPFTLPHSRRFISIMESFSLSHLGHLQRTVLKCGWINRRVCCYTSRSYRSSDFVYSLSYTSRHFGRKTVFVATLQQQMEIAPKLLIPLFLWHSTINSAKSFCMEQSLSLVDLTMQQTVSSLTGSRSCSMEKIFELLDSLADFTAQYN